MPGHRPADNHVHSQWSHDTGPRASMAAACARAVELGLPAVAFTEHLDFTDGDRATRSRAPASAPNDQWGPRPLDVDGYLSCAGGVPATASLRCGSCPVRKPASRTCSRAAPPQCCPPAVSTGSSAPCTRCPAGAGWSTPGRCCAASRRPRLMRRYFAEVVAMIEGSDLFEVLAPPGLPAAVLARVGGALPGDRLRGGVPRGAAGAGLLGPGPGTEHGQPARLGQPAALVAPRKAARRCRSAATRTCPGTSASGSARRPPSPRRPASGPAAIPSISGAASPPA